MMSITTSAGVRTAGLSIRLGCTQGDRLLTVEDLADWLGVPVATVYAWRYRRSGPPSYKVGRHLRYRRSDEIQVALVAENGQEAALAVALTTAACASPSGLLDGDLASPGTPEPPAAAPDDGGTPGEPTVIDRQCYGEDDDRCGMVLVDQSLDDSEPRSRIALRFRVSQADTAGRPVLVLSGSEPAVSIDDLELPGRPLIEMTPRGAWPSEPQLTCVVETKRGSECENPLDCLPQPRVPVDHLDR